MPKVSPYLEGSEATKTMYGDEFAKDLYHKGAYNQALYCFNIFHPGPVESGPARSRHGQDIEGIDGPGSVIGFVDARRGSGHKQEMKQKTKTKKQNKQKQKTHITQLLITKTCNNTHMLNQNIYKDVTIKNVTIKMRRYNE